MKKILFVSLVCFLLGFSAHHFLFLKQSAPVSFKKISPKEKTLLAYSFENLKKTTFQKNEIRLGKIIHETTDIITHMFYFDVPDKPNSKNYLTVSGVLNIPKKPGTYPVILMFRGYVPEEVYTSGVGTQRVAETFAQNKFITLAPDFLGYEESSPPSNDSFEARFQTYTTALALFSSLSTLNASLDASYSGTIKPNIEKTGVWAHSNGGQIALSTLAISGLSYPTVLWAPVSKSFPYSILFYTDETKDQGKALRKALALFEKDYNTEDFSPARYYWWIKAPLSIYQGDNDIEVPNEWSNELVELLQKEDVIVEYNRYPGSDHNMVPSWSAVVQDNIQYYNNQFK